MIKVFSVDQIRKADQYTIQNEPISSIDLMERAANRLLNWVQENWDETQVFCICCGPGNNGGDGLALARMLSEKGYKVQVFALDLGGSFSSDFEINLKRLKQKVNLIKEASDVPEFGEDEVIVDAIFGTGLSRAPEGLAETLINAINASYSSVISVDIPSGLFADQTTPHLKETVVRADFTLSFQFPKLAMLMPENGLWVGEWHLLDIQLSESYINNTQTDKSLFTMSDAKAIAQNWPRFSHKGNRGRARIMAGSKGKIGAALLASRACLRAGAGLLTVQVPKVGYSILQSQLPEAMVIEDENENCLSTLLKDQHFDALGIGPGLGMNEDTQNLLKLIIQNLGLSAVFDADALNILAENKTWLAFLPAGNILTPHPGEFKRLVGEWDNDFERLEKLKEFSIKHKQYVVLKGAFTTIACPDGKLFFNTTGNAGMATGGSGDALTGIITALLAQGYKTEQAALLGVYLHGLAGDLAADEVGMHGMLPSDLIERLPRAYELLLEN